MVNLLLCKFLQHIS